MDWQIVMANSSGASSNRMRQAETIVDTAYATKKYIYDNFTSRDAD